MWIAICGYIFSQVPLESKDAEEAKREAEGKLYNILNEAMKDL